MMEETVENASDIQPGEDKNAQKETDKTGDGVSEENMSSKHPTADNGASAKAKKEDLVTGSDSQSAEDKKTLQKSEEESVDSETGSQPANGNAVLKKTVETEDACGTKNEMEKCEEYIERLKLRHQTAKETGDRGEEADVYSDLGILVDMLGSFKQAMGYHKVDLQIAKEIGDRSREGRAYCNLGIACKNLGDFKQAIEYQQLALKFAKEENNKEKEGKSYDNLGVVYQDLGNLNQAEEYHKMHRQIAIETGNRAAEGRACCNLGLLCNSRGDYKKAKDYHTLDLQFAKELRDRASEGRAYCNLGVVYRNMGDSKQAIWYDNLYLCITKETGDRAGKARAYKNLGLDHDNLSDFKQGFEYHKLFLQAAKEMGDRAGEGGAYCSLGRSYLHFGDLKQAIDCHKMDLQIAKELENKTNEARAYCNLAIAYESVGKYEEALENNKLLLKTTKELGHKAGEARAYCNLGTVYWNLGDYKQSIDYTERGMGIAKTVRNLDGLGRAYCHLGLAHASLGEYDQAIKYHKLHLDVTKRLRDKVSEGRANANLGVAYRNVGNLKQAIYYHNQDLHIAKELGDRRGESRAYCNLGNAYYDLFDFKQATYYYQLFLPISKELGDKPGLARAHGNIGNVKRSLGDFKQALQYYELDLQLSKEMADPDGEGLAHYCCGICFEALELLGDALLSYQASVKTFNSLRELLQTKDEWKISLRNQHQMSYKATLRILLKQNKFVEALSAAEQGRAQALEDLLIQQYGFQVAQFSTEDGSSDGIFYYTPSTVLYHAVEDNDIDMWVVRNRDSVHFWKEKVDFKRLEIKAVTDLKSLIDKVVTLISPPSDGRCEDRSLNSLSGRDSTITENEETPEVETESYPLEKEATEDGFRETPEKETRGGTEETAVLKQDTCSKTDDGKETLTDDVDVLLRILYDMTIRPVEEWVRGSELIIVPEGALFLAPFAAFLDSESRYLSESFRIRVAPSLNTLKLISDAPAGYHSTNGALIVGDPYVKEVVEKKGRQLVGLLDQLPNAKKEAEMIGRILNCTPLIGKEATKGAVLSKLNTVALIHIAAHGNRETGEIALTPDPARHSKIPKKEDFVLTMAEVLSVGLRAQLVVLSCCHSGTGSIKAEGVVGIARAFLGAGARSVLVSLWALHDEATLEFMRSFYQKLVLYKNPSKALEQAMKCMRESTTFHAVKYWAPFVLIGDDVTLDYLERLDPELQIDD